MTYTRFFVLILTIGFFLIPCSAVLGQMTIHHINVGQADATLLEFKTAAVLVDSGGSGTPGDPDREHLRLYLEKFFTTRPDLKRTFYSFIITHPHIDHTKYIMDVLKGYSGHKGFIVKNFIDNGDSRQASGTKQVKDARAFINQLNAGGTVKLFYNKVDAADIGPNGYTTSLLTALAASASAADIRFFNASRDCKNKNNDSLVVLVTYGTTKILIAGDAEWDPGDEGVCVPAITRMEKKFGQTSLLDADVYKVGHHGADNGTDVDWLKLMTPKISVISAGSYKDLSGDNFDAWHYGHPRKNVIEELIANTSGSRPTKSAYGMDRAKGNAIPMTIKKAVYCTCWDGDIVIKADDKSNMTVTTSQ